MGFWNSKKVLVTGGCGFLGSYLVEELVAENALVTVVDNLEMGSLENISNVLQEVRFIQADLRDLATCSNLSREMEIIMNFVGKNQGVGYSSNHHGEMFFENMLTHLNVLEAARINRAERLLVVSSSCVYPDDAPVPTPELPVMTGFPEKANEGYGWAKRMAELQAQYYHKEYAMKIAICRPFNPYGPRYRWRGEENSHVLPTLIKKVMDGGSPIVVWGSGRQCRNFIHARDAVRLAMLITEKSTTAEPVNIGYEEEISMAELVSLICKVTGRNPEVVFDVSKPEGRFRKCVDSTLLRKITENYVPTIRLEEGIEEMIQWYNKNFNCK